MMELWSFAKIGDVAQIVNGGTPKSKVPEYWDGDVLWITPKDMGRLKSTYVADTTRKITRAGLAKSSAKLIPANSVILSTRAPIGHLAINSAPMATNQGCRGLVPLERLDTKFLFYFLSFNVALLNDLGSGTTFKELSKNALAGVELPLPPLPEQKRIVAILDEAIAGIGRAAANAEKNLANARELFETTVVSKFFGDPDDKGWQSATVDELALAEKGSIRTGPFGSQLLHGEFVDEGIAVLGIDNAVANEFKWDKRRFITEQKYRELARYTVKPGDVLITIMGTCGRCAIVPGDIPKAINSKHLCCISLDKSKCLPEFLHGYFLYHPIAREFLTARAKGSVMDGLNMGIIKELPVRFPEVDEQKSIVRKMDSLLIDLRNLEAIYDQKLDDLAELKQSILQKAFSGELTAQPDQALKEAVA